MGTEGKEEVGAVAQSRPVEEVKETVAIGIVLIDEAERLTYKHKSGAEIYYRRLPLDIAGKLQDDNTITTRKGEKLNSGALTIAMLKYIILGWEGVGLPVDGGTLTEFESSLIVRIPDDIQADLLELSKANAALKELEATRKN